MKLVTSLTAELPWVSPGGPITARCVVASHVAPLLMWALPPPILRLRRAQERESQDAREAVRPGRGVAVKQGQ